LNDSGATENEIAWASRWNNWPSDWYDDVADVGAVAPAGSVPELCAASSPLIVTGEICEPALNPVDGTGLAETGAGLATSNGLAEPWSKPVDDAEDDSDDVSD
jgi:hypothetical protein